MRTFGSGGDEQAPRAKSPDPHTPRAVGRERAQPARSSPAETRDLLLRDEQALLAGAVQRLQRVTGASQVTAWVRDGDAAPRVVAAAFESAPPAPPDARAFDAVVELGMATAFSLQSAPVPLRLLVETHGAAVAAPVLRAGREPLAVLVLAGRRGPLTRPRTLAALDASCAQLAGPLAAARAASRLAGLEGELQRLDRLAALGSLAAEVAHEIRNPLVSVKTFLQLLPERGGDSEFTSRFLAVAGEELARVERLLDGIAGTPRTEQDDGPTSAADGVAALAELLRPLAAKRDVALVASSEPELPDVACGPDALRQMLLNLALNALEATPARGRVRVAARRGGAADVEISVVDSGPGLPAGADVFESSGLGLMVTRRLAEAAGGRVTADDTPEGGARFTLRLPFAS